MHKVKFLIRSTNEPIVSAKLNLPYNNSVVRIIYKCLFFLSYLHNIMIQFNKLIQNRILRHTFSFKNIKTHNLVEIAIIGLD